MTVVLPIWVSSLVQLDLGVQYHLGVCPVILELLVANGLRLSPTELTHAAGRANNRALDSSW